MNHMFTARPLEPEEAKEFREHTLSLMDEIDKAKRDNARLWKYLAIGGVVVGLSGMWFYGQLAPMLRVHVEDHYFAADQIHGFVKETGGPADAPKMFNEIIAQAAVKTYLDNWFTYQWQTDQTRFNRVQLMSSDDQFARYVAWHDKDPLAPRQKLGRKGEIMVSDHMSLTKEPSDKDGTLQYSFLINLQKTEGGAVSPWKSCSGDIAFQWHPEETLTEDQRRDNPTGMVVIMMHACQDPT